ncbi:MAG: TonB-dependent receptor plug domain-containing protein [Segetibacter sp.]
MKRFLLLFLILSTITHSCYAQSKVIIGQVTDQKNNKPMSNVTVQVKGTGIGTSTNAEGKFSINAPANGTLTFSFISYSTKEIPVNNRSTINVTLAAEASALGDVLIIGYGTQRKKDLTGSITSLNPTSYKDQPVLNASAALQGRVAGLEVTNTSGAPGGEAKIHIRGANSINSSNNPLYVVDGIALSSIGLQDINVNDIKSMEVLKDASATAIYGSRGANGVILITTKSGNSGNIRIDYNGFLNSNSPLNKYKLRNAVDFAKEANYIAGSNVFRRSFLIRRKIN